MSDYDRITRECSVSQLCPELLQALRNYFQEHELGDLETETLRCYETISKKKSANKLVSWLNGQLDTAINVGILLTAGWLIWVRHGNQSGTLVTAANLKEIQVKVYASKITKDTGLEVYGHIGDSRGRVRGYLGIESELVAQKFCDEVKRAIYKVNPPTKKHLPRWLGG
jgi:hypothetical protein